VNSFILQILRKFDKLSKESARGILANIVDDSDRLKTALDSINVGILVCDSNHRLLLTNKFAERTLSIKHYEHSNDCVWMVIEEELVSGFIQKTLSDGDKVEGYEFEINGRCGITRLLSLTVLPLVKHYKVTGSIILVENITKRRSKEAKMHRIETLASLTTLAASVAHEIKNPLASISIHIHLVKKILKRMLEEFAGEKESFDKMSRYLDVIDEEIQRLNDTVVDFLFAVRPMELTMLKADINQFLESVVNFIALELEQNNIRYKMELTPDLPFVKFDDRYMREAVFNITRNAIEAMSEKGGLLTVKTRKTDTDVIISITDTGAGMSEETQLKIFEPYFTTKDTGTGLGLTLVFKVIREHHGELNVYSKLGEGSTFNITLPIPQIDGYLLDYSDGI
jgi:PAS domain S-box-containing protein